MHKVAIQGIKGSFHQEAAEEFFKGEDISYLECLSFPEVVKSVRGSDADYGVIAIENALIGTILTNYRLIQNNNLKVIGEVYLPIKLNLLALPGQSKEDLKEVWSHPLAILQSENYLDEHEWQVVKKFDTARCAKDVYQNGRRGIGVLASPKAARYYRLSTLDENVQNADDTFTRFFIVAKKNEPVKDANKVSLTVTLSNTSGSLVNFLHKMSDIGVNLSKIMSVPLTHDQGKYIFYIDVEFSNEEQYQEMINHLKDDSDDVIIFGKYKR